MTIKFKWNRGDWVWYIYHNFLGGSYAILGRGIVDAFSYRSDMLDHPLPDDYTYNNKCYEIRLPRYESKPNGDRGPWIIATEKNTFRTIVEAKIEANKQGLFLLPNHFVLKR